MTLTALVYRLADGLAAVESEPVRLAPSEDKTHDWRALLRMIAGLEEITSGRIRIGERAVNNLNPKDRDIAMVFQIALWRRFATLQTLPKVSSKA